MPICSFGLALALVSPVPGNASTRLDGHGDASPSWSAIALGMSNVADSRQAVPMVVTGWVRAVRSDMTVCAFRSGYAAAMSDTVSLPAVSKVPDTSAWRTPSRRRFSARLARLRSAV